MVLYMKYNKGILNERKRKEKGDIISLRRKGFFLFLLLLLIII